MDVLSSQAVLGTILHKSTAGIHHEYALTGMGVLLVDNNQAGRDASAIEQVGGKTNDALDVALADQRAAYILLRITTE